MIRSRPRPISSARAAESSADWIIASRVTQRMSRGLSGGGVLVHQVGQQGLVERAPIGADADRLAVPDRHLDDGAELPVLLLLEADIARVDAVFVEGLGAGRMIGQQLVADIMEIADQRHGDAEPVQTVADARDGGRGLVAVDGDADDFGTGARERRDLSHRRVHIGRVRVGHRLDHDGSAAADHHRPDAHADAPVPRGWTRRGFGGCFLRDRLWGHQRRDKLHTSSPVRQQGAAVD